MLRSALRAPRLYEVKRGRTQPADPALLLATSMWDLTPGPPPLLTTSTEDSIQGSYILDAATHARRGLPVVQFHPGVPVDEDAMGLLNELLGRAKGFEGSSVDLVLAIQQEIQDPFVVNVVPSEFIVTPLDRPTVQYRCPGTAEVKCGAVVSPSASSRLRRHDTPAGGRCPRTNTPLTDEEREAGLIRPVS